MARQTLTTTIDRSGPFFTKDPTKTFRANVRVLMDAIAAEGEADVKAQMAAAGSQGRAVIPYVRGRTHALGGKRWAVHAVVSVDTSHLGTADAVRIMAIASGRHKATDRTGRHIGLALGIEDQLHPFRRTTGRLRRARAINVAELTKGL